MSNVDLAQNHYRVLGLSFPTQVSSHDIKAAYRRALLLNHPDKSGLETTSSRSTFTVDQIAWAYQVLSNPSSRKAFDETLTAVSASSLPTKTKPLTGLDTLDLDDLDYDKSSSIWFHSCRCGSQKGYIITEEDLEREADHGEVIMGCKGCSLHILVTFALSD